MTLTVLAGVLLLLFPFRAHAYVDPQIGSALYQGIIGGLLAVGAAWKLLGRRIRDFLKKFR